MSRCTGQFVSVMVDGFGLDTVAKLALAFRHDSNDCALSSRCHTTGSLVAVNWPTIHSRRLSTIHRDTVVLSGDVHYVVI